MGMSERTYRENKQIVKGLSDKAKDAIKDSKASKTDALKLSRLGEETQNKIAEQVASGLLKADSDVSKPQSFVADTSEKSGISQTVIKEELRLTNNLTPEAKECHR